LKKNQLIYFRIQEILFLIEMIYIYQHYYNWKQVETAIKEVLKISGLEINLTGKKNLFFFSFQRIIYFILKVNLVNEHDIK